MRITRRAFSLGSGIGLFAASRAGAQGVGVSVNPDAASVLTELREAFPIPAVSAAVFRNGQLVWQEAQGLAEVELGVPANPGHLFRIGSVSKVVTAAIGVRLAAARTIDLDAPIATYRPELPEVHHATTLRQLYAHQGGIRHYLESDYDLDAPGGIIDLRFYDTTEDALALFINDPLVAEPGTRSNYSTFGYTLLSAVLESATGKSFEQLIIDEVVEPLGLQELSSDHYMQPVPGRVRNYDTPQFYDRLGAEIPSGPVLNSIACNTAYKRAAGGIVALARDIARFGSALLTDGYLDGASRNMLFQPIVAATEGSPATGLGWRIDSAEGFGTRYHHGGTLQGCRAQLVLYPEHGLSVALLSNLGNTPGDILDWSERIARAFRG